MKTIVVAAALITREGRILITQRREEDDRGLLWEFPGGKVEEGEDPRQTLERELQEEIGIKGEAGALFDATFHFYPEHPILLLVFHCQIREGIPRPLGCRDLCWASLDELRELTMPPADEPIRSHLLFSGTQGGRI
jgi:8-oxo-dGTP diphosphatase